MEPTNRVLLRQLEEEMNNLFGLGDRFDLDLEEDQELLFDNDSVFGSSGLDSFRYDGEDSEEGFG